MTRVCITRDSDVSTIDLEKENKKDTSVLKEKNTKKDNSPKKRLKLIKSIK